MHLEILTPESRIFSGTVRLVSLPGSNGAFAILKGHAPLISTLETGKIKVIDASGITHFFDIKRGVVECMDNKVHVLVNIE
ncbi:MAG: ATP synthase F1 subunit epsilon [Bacteroidetes bacterium GWF2_49_14]|nr:MAG: ATP synthase F1 subunit epsilon [Bacteroidetes bacterium GWF2_49_14]HBB90355.1 ATP synthase F1 subunit epsilon [Bacteroidales bacterium]